MPRKSKPQPPVHVVQAVVLNAPPKTSAAKLAEIFDADGLRRVIPQMFAPVDVSPVNLINRRTVLAALATSEAAAFMALSFEARKAAFAFVKYETARYNGTAKREDGSVRPQLRFSGRIEAASYRELLKRAMTGIARHVYRQNAELAVPSGA